MNSDYINDELDSIYSGKCWEVQQYFGYQIAANKQYRLSQELINHDCESIPSCDLKCECLPASCPSNANTYRPRALLYCKYFRPRAHNKTHRQLGLMQIRIALQEVCNVIVISQSQIKQQQHISICRF